MERQAVEQLRRRKHYKIMHLNEDHIPDGWELATETDEELAFENGSDYTVTVTESFVQSARHNGSFIHKVRMDGPDSETYYSGFRNEYSDGGGAINCARNVMRTITALQD